MKKRRKSGFLSKAKKSAKSALRKTGSKLKRAAKKTGSKLKRAAKKAAAATGIAKRSSTRELLGRLKAASLGVAARALTVTDGDRGVRWNRHTGKRFP